MAPPPQNPMQGVPEHIRSILARLHAESLAQESQLTTDDFFAGGEQAVARRMRDKFIALEEDKAQYVYGLARATGALTVVEAGTSFGVSTIYLALAAAANARRAGGGGGQEARVVATEHEPEKARRARAHWDECGEEVSGVIDLRVGDLRETLKEDLERVDFLLLDIWTPMALPTLKIVQPKMRPGAVVIADNTIMAAEGYADYLNYMRSPDSGFINMTLPFKNGLEMSIYCPQK